MYVKSIKTQLAITFSIVLIVLVNAGLITGKQYYRIMDDSTAIRDLTAKAVALSRSTQVYQGYFFSRPLPPDEFIKFIENGECKF